MFDNIDPSPFKDLKLICSVSILISLTKLDPCKSPDASPYDVIFHLVNKQQ